MTDCWVTFPLSAKCDLRSKKKFRETVISLWKEHNKNFASASAMLVLINNKNYILFGTNPVQIFRAEFKGVVSKKEVEK